MPIRTLILGAACAATLAFAGSAHAITGGAIVVNPEPVVTTQPVTFTVVTEGAQGALTYDWDYDGNGSYEVTGDTSNTKTFTFPLDMPSSGTINVYVNDAGSAGQLLTKTYQIVRGADTRPLVATLTAGNQRISKVLVSGFLFRVTSTHSATLGVTMSAVVGAKKYRFARFTDSVNATSTTVGQRNLSRYPAVRSRAAKALRKVKRAKILVEVKVTDERGQVKTLTRSFIVRR
ncbi:MAG TPA: hypothetical protein VFZ89_06815 [Solirubrobacteraceae bacterium]